jgi:uncharacterized protein (DUF2235 family)
MFADMFYLLSLGEQVSRQVLMVLDLSRWKQEKIYVNGIGSAEDLQILERLRLGAFGHKSLDQIRDVYQECCRLDGPNDEVWLYGFSRGAYVVRAVAGLLHYIRAVTSADLPTFQEDYKQALSVYAKMQKQDKLGEGQVSHRSRATTISYISDADFAHPYRSTICSLRIHDKRRQSCSWARSTRSKRLKIGLCTISLLTIQLNT